VASARGHKQVVKLLLNKGANVNAQGGSYRDALHAASFSGYEQIVKLLLNKGAFDDQIADQTSSDARPRSAKSLDSLGADPSRSSDKE
jgi:ankyrin repeat protein